VDCRIEASSFAPAPAHLFYIAKHTKWSAAELTPGQAGETIAAIRFIQAPGCLLFAMIQNDPRPNTES
jgi:hypothetical protein